MAHAEWIRYNNDSGNYFIATRYRNAFIAGFNALAAKFGVGTIPAWPLKMTGTPGAATVGTPYLFQPNATGGIGTARIYSIVSGSRPTGLNSIQATYGYLNGTPMAAGTFNFTVRCSDGTNTVDLPCTIKVS